MDRGKREGTSRRVQQGPRCGGRTEWVMRTNRGEEAPGPAERKWIWPAYSGTRLLKPLKDKQAELILDREGNTEPTAGI